MTIIKDLIMLDKMRNVYLYTNGYFSVNSDQTRLGEVRMDLVTKHF